MNRRDALRLFLRRRLIVPLTALGAGASIVASLACGVTPPADPNNEMPFGFVDVPRDGDIVSRTVTVGGWALDDARVEAVRFYVNGEYQASARPTLPRPDVSQAFRNYPAREHLHGWQIELDLGESVGPHAILVRAVDEDGATRDIGQVSVTIISR